MRMRPGSAAVEGHDLVGLDGARRQHGVGAVDDGRLGLGPAVRHVGLDLFGHRLGLDPVERVEGAHERQVQLVLDHVARQPRQPVVGVHRGVGHAAAVVVAGRRRGGHPLEDPGRELVDDAGQGLLGHDAERAGRHVVHAQPGLDVDDRGELVGPGPGEDVTGDPGAGQCRGQLPHVDVHAAAVAGARLGQGRGVQGEDGEPAHGGQSLPAARKTSPAPPGGAILRRWPPGRADRAGPPPPAARREGLGRGWLEVRAGAAPPRARAGRRGRCARGPASAPR